MARKGYWSLKFLGVVAGLIWLLFSLRFEPFRSNLALAFLGSVLFGAASALFAGFVIWLYLRVSNKQKL
jgi:hypothetical protein